MPVVVPEEEPLEAQGVSPASEDPSPSTHGTTTAPESQVAASVAGVAARPQSSSVISPLRGAPTAQPQPAPPVIVATPSAVEGSQIAEPSPQIRPAGAPADDIVYTPFALSIGDGFKFGCGLVLAMFVTVMTLALLAAVVFLLASLAGVSFPLGMVGK